MAIGVQQLQRRATAAVWAASGYTLAQGELGVTTDTGIIKIGDGSNTWNDLDPAFDSQYLPILGKAADSDLLDGISASGFIQLSDVAVTATADKVVRRDGDGQIRAAAGTSSDDVVNYTQLVDSGKELVSRTVTSAFTLAVGDINSMVLVNNSAYTPTVVCTVPPNASVSIPIGSFVDIRSGDKGPVTLTAGSGVTLTGQVLIQGGGGSATILKTGTDTWIVTRMLQSPGPILRRKIKPGSDNSLGTGFTKLRLDGADSGTALFSNNADTLGTNEQYNAGTDIYKCYCRRSGWYDVSAQMTLNTDIDERRYVSLKINGIDQKLGSGARAGILDSGPGFSTLVPLNVGDYVEVWGFREGGTTLQVTDTNDSHSIFEWVWLRNL